MDKENICLGYHQWIRKIYALDTTNGQGKYMPWIPPMDKEIYMPWIPPMDKENICLGYHQWIRKIYALDTTNG